MDYKISRPYEAVSRWIIKYCFGRYLHHPALKVIGGVKRDMRHHGRTLSFLKALVMNPRATGAILPSSKRLARAMVAHIKFTDETLVVELGAGTGVITQAMLDCGIPSQQIIAVEYSPHLVKKLRQGFPGITVIEGDAAHLVALLKDKAQPVGTIISGLPLRSLPVEMKDSILTAISDVLSVKGRYIQFTYDIRKNKDSYYPDHYKLAESAIVWRNIPPAKVGVYTLESL